jgi:hypothetical protein
MNWIKALIAGVVGGIVVSLANYLMYGVIMAQTYIRYSDVFTQEAANPLYFFLVAICIAIPASILFAKTRSCWADGVKGGVVYGFWIGLVSFFEPFYDPLVLEGFPYYLGWCHGGISLIGFVILGIVLGLIYKQ